MLFKNFVPQITAIHPALHVIEPIMLARDLSQIRLAGIFLIKELILFSLMVMYHNDLIIFRSDNYKCNSTCHFHMFIYFYVSIFISLTNIYPL